MVTETKTPIQLQQQCPPIGAEFGRPANPALLRDPAFRDVIEELSTDIEAVTARTAEDMNNGEAAGRALKALGCAACELSQVCTVRETLEERHAIGRETREVVEKATMIAAAPTWLKAARFNKSGITRDEMQQLLTDDEAAAKAMQEGVLDRLIGDVTNKPLSALKKADLPETKGLSVVAPERPLPTEEITNKHGQKFVVVDATNQNHSKDSITDESRTEYGILCAKFVDRMNALGPDGLPLILQQDPNLKMQKVIKRIDSDGISAVVYEMRMTGKNRLYFSVVKSPDGPDGPVARMVILGAHGGDASTQRAFINTSLN